jgi:hypothetical protein
LSTAGRSTSSTATTPVKPMMHRAAVRSSHMIHHSFRVPVGCVGRYVINRTL